MDNGVFDARNAIAISRHAFEQDEKSQTANQQESQVMYPWESKLKTEKGETVCYYMLDHTWCLQIILK